MLKRLKHLYIYILYFVNTSIKSTWDDKIVADNDNNNFHFLMICLAFMYEITDRNENIKRVWHYSEKPLAGFWDNIGRPCFLKI